MDFAEAQFIARATTLADSGAFANASRLAVALRSEYPSDARRWLRTDLLRALDKRCKRATANRSSARPH